MAKPANTLIPFVAALAALALGVFAALQLWRPAPAPELASGILLPQPRAVAPFQLLDQDGKPFTRERLQGQWTVLFAGFTHCPDVCPTTLQLLKQLEGRLAQSGRPLQTVFLSVDPQRDTPEQLLRYVRHFSPAFTGVTGSREQLDALCASLGLAYVKVPGANDQDYTVDHSAALVLLNADGNVAGYFQPPFKLDALANDLEQVLPRAS